MKIYHISAENDNDAARTAVGAFAAIQAAGGTVTSALNFESDPSVPSVIVAILPDDVEPAQFFEGREITHAGDLITVKVEQPEEEQPADDHEAEDERDSGGEDGGEEGEGEGAESDEAAS